MELEVLVVRTESKPGRGWVFLTWHCIEVQLVLVSTLSIHNLLMQVTLRCRQSLWYIPRDSS